MFKQLEGLFFVSCLERLAIRSVLACAGSSSSMATGPGFAVGLAYLDSSLLLLLTRYGAPKCEKISAVDAGSGRVNAEGGPDVHDFKKAVS